MLFPNSDRLSAGSNSHCLKKSLDTLFSSGQSLSVEIVHFDELNFFRIGRVAQELGPADSHLELGFPIPLARLLRVHLFVSLPEARMNASLPRVPPMM